MSFHVNILTLFPEMFPGALGLSLSGKALERGDWSYEAVNIRNFAGGVHKAVDDTPYGGGAGMVMRADILGKAHDSVAKTGRHIYMSPRGKPLNQDLVQQLAAEDVLTILCGRYEGVDQRFLDEYDYEEISLGDYVLAGGESAALVMLEACIRLLPGVMGNSATTDEESFAGEGLLEYPHYTRPALWNNREVPEILRSGDHKRIEDWRQEQSLALTKARRPDLLKK